jgi:hypothetical protein
MHVHFSLHFLKIIGKNILKLNEKSAAGEKLHQKKLDYFIMLKKSSKISSQNPMEKFEITTEMFQWKPMGKNQKTGRDKLKKIQQKIPQKVQQKV